MPLDGGLVELRVLAGGITAAQAIDKRAALALRQANLLILAVTRLPSDLAKFTTRLASA